MHTAVFGETGGSAIYEQHAGLVLAPTTRYGLAFSKEDVKAYKLENRNTAACFKFGRAVGALTSMASSRDSDLIVWSSFLLLATGSPASRSHNRTVQSELPGQSTKQLVSRSPQASRKENHRLPAPFVLPSFKPRRYCLSLELDSS